jgi:putative ABC transport system substrate-binding protein
LNKKIVPILIGVCIVLAVALVLVLALGIGSQPAQQATKYKIGIFQIISHPALNDAREGFKDAFKAALAAKGLNESDVVFMESNAAGSMDTCYTIADYFVSQKVSLICAISTPCAIAAATAVNGTNIPVVFNSVTNPADAGIENPDEPSGQMTGVSDVAPVEPNLQLIQEILDYNNLTLSKLGVIYNAGEPNSVYQVDTQLTDALAALNLTGNVTVVKSTVSTGADIPAAANTLVAANVSAIWVPTDNTVVAGIEAVVGPCEDHHIPLFAADVSTVARGAVGCWGMEYYQVGNLSGQMAADILQNGVDPSTMPIGFVPANLLYLYPQEAERQGVTIPDELLAEATKIVTD